MPYDLDTLLANSAEPKVYDTIIVTLCNEREPIIEKLRSEKEATAWAQMFVKDWLKMPESTMEILDDHNIILKVKNHPAILVTREYDVLQATLDNIKRTMTNWGK